MYGNIKSVYRWAMNTPINFSPNGVCVRNYKILRRGEILKLRVWLINLTT